ncbi:hypothetical protein DAI22_02g040600 [Oryza sativa Japonica Group]|nr:hypothetical protein DAI22_02g040600 [Oryza sativa Japonica Group]
MAAAQGRPPGVQDGGRHEGRVAVARRGAGDEAVRHRGRQRRPLPPPQRRAAARLLPPERRAPACLRLHAERRPGPVVARPGCAAAGLGAARSRHQRRRRRPALPPQGLGAGGRTPRRQGKQRDNVLLDGEMDARLGDFGLARLYGRAAAHGAVAAGAWRKRGGARAVRLAVAEDGRRAGRRAQAPVDVDEPATARVLHEEEEKEAPAWPPSASSRPPPPPLGCEPPSQPLHAATRLLAGQLASSTPPRQRRSPGEVRPRRRGSEPKDAAGGRPTRPVSGVARPVPPPWQRARAPFRGRPYAHKVFDGLTDLFCSCSSGKRFVHHLVWRGSSSKKTLSCPSGNHIPATMSRNSF